MASRKLKIETALQEALKDNFRLSDLLSTKYEKDVESLHKLETTLTEYKNGRKPDKYLDKVLLEYQLSVYEIQLLNIEVNKALAMTSFLYRFLKGNKIKTGFDKNDNNQLEVLASENEIAYKLEDNKLTPYLEHETKLIRESLMKNAEQIRAKFLEGVKTNED